jgi:hypothetical protein
MSAGVVELSSGSLDLNGSLGGYRARVADWQRFMSPLNPLRFIMIC